MVGFRMIQWRLQAESQMVWIGLLVRRVWRVWVEYGWPRVIRELHRRMVMVKARMLLLPTTGFDSSFNRQTEIL